MATESTNIKLGLVALLDEAGWSPRKLGHELNRVFGRGTVSVTAPYHWRNHGGVPRRPLPEYTAKVFSRQLNRTISASDIWADAFPATDHVTLATEGLEGPWSFDATMEVADDWLSGGFVNRRTFLQVSGTALAQALSPYLSAATSTGSFVPTTTASQNQLVEEIQTLVPRLQILDDNQGGGAGLDFVGNQLRCVLQVLRGTSVNNSATRQLLIATADLAQLAGWKAVDAARPGLAQRYLLTGLRAARDAGYRSMEAHILADLAFQSASLGHGTDGVVLGEAACEVAQRSTAGVKASIQSRLAFAYAACGRSDDLEGSWLDAHETMTNRGLASEPDWMYYLTPNHLDCQAGYSMILAGIRSDDKRAARKLYSRGADLLRTGAYARAIDEDSQRRALYEGSWLALGYTRHGKLEEAADVIELVLPRLEQVQSPRSVELLSIVAKDMRRRQRNHRISDVLPDLESALTRQPSLALV